HASGINRSATPNCDRTVVTLDLDHCPDENISCPDDYTLLYTVAPDSDAEEDPRLSNLLNLLAPAPTRVVYISSSGVYGDCGGRLIDENQPTNPANKRAQHRQHAEEKLRRWCATENAGLITLRVAGIYGPGRLGRKRILAGQPIIAESDANPGNRIHVDDLARCCVAAMTADAASGIYNISDGDHRSPSWFSRTVAELAGLAPAPQVPLSEALATFNDTRLSFLRDSRRLDNSKMLAELNPALRYADAEAGIRASLVNH
ncbi:MAG: nucleoside-diphosphate-sugar epimerase, partial [Woeseiaceae bacterium]